MTDYVVDTSVVIEYLIAGPYTVNAQAFFARLSPNETAIVPEFCLMEATNVLWKHMRFQGMSQQRANAALRDLRQMPLKRVPVKQLLGKALSIGMRHNLAVYDSMYIALAQRSNFPLISIDHPQILAATAEGVVVKPVTDFK